jgi:hypothetical protein
VSSTRLLTPMRVKDTILHIQLNSQDDPARFETCRRKLKLNITLENFAFRLFVLYNETLLLS